MATRYRTTGLIVGSLGLQASISTAQPVDPCFNLNLMQEPVHWAGCPHSRVNIERLEECEKLVADPWPPAQPIFVHVVVSRDPDLAGGIGGLQFGIEYTADVLAWTICGYMEIPQAGWPASGIGNAIVLDDGCYEPQTNMTTVGFFYVETGNVGTFRITPDPRIGQALWATCEPSSYEIPLQNLGDVDLSEGFDPTCAVCGPNPSLETSWGRVKALYGSPSAATE
jgi:hypothetical protein